jgi:hypothetical protein
MFEQISLDAAAPIYRLILIIVGLTILVEGYLENRAFTSTSNRTRSEPAQ